MSGTGRPWEEIDNLPMTNLLSLLKYWNKFPPVNELVARFFEYTGDDHG
jgi:hypothetical protein